MPTKNIERAQRMMFAMLPNELALVKLLVCPTRGMPHSGLIPMGAEMGSAERPLRDELENFWSCC